VVGKLVGVAISESVDLAELSLSALRAESELITADVFAVLTLDGSVNARNHPGGTAPTQVTAAIAAARTHLENVEKTS
jgi:argininosuccinate lyase